jgi:uncharacterized membrane protein YcaP (DUF421 family)
MENLFFDTWESLGRTALIALFGYLSLLIMLRIVGSRTLSQLNAFDLIVTVALGSTLASAILTKNVSLADGILGLAMLIGLQWSISKLSIRFKAFQNVINTEPKLLYFKGKYLEKALNQCRISKEEISQVIRATGAARLEEADAVVLETNGKFSVIKQNEKDGQSALKNVEGFPPHS